MAPGSSSEVVVAAALASAAKQAAGSLSGPEAAAALQSAGEQAAQSRLEVAEEGLGKSLAVVEGSHTSLEDKEASRTWEAVAEGLHRLEEWQAE